MAPREKKMKSKKETQSEIEVTCIGKCKRVFCKETDKIVLCDRCSNYICIGCLGMGEEQYKLIKEDWCTVMCNDCRPSGNKEIKEGRSVEVQCNEFLDKHSKRMSELESKIDSKADKTEVDKLSSEQIHMNSKIDGIAEDISKLNKKFELFYTEENAKSNRDRNLLSTA